MFDYIKGILTRLSQGEATLENGGIGYRLLVADSVVQKLPGIGSEATLYIAVVVREDSHRYFGFLTAEDRAFFEMLIELSGIGPKTAQAILGQYEPFELIELARLEDVNKISKVPGVGKKTAERLIVELKGKQVKFIPITPSTSAKPSQFHDALSALVQLGFAYPQAQKAVAYVLEEKGAEVSLSELITASLQKIRG